MSSLNTLRRAFILSCCALFTHSVTAAQPSQRQLQQIVDNTVRPILQQNNIPGMSIGITVAGKRYFFNYGLASKQDNLNVTEHTLFELGSVSKTYTATLTGYAQAQRKLSLSDSAGKYWTELANSPLEKVSLLELGTYSAGGLPLQFPDSVTDDKTMLDYYQRWQPAYPAGTYRQYSNASIGLMGFLTAKSLSAPFDTVMERQLLPKLGLSETYIRVPENKIKQYAYGYSKQNKAIRVTPGVLDAEAYGIKASAADVLTFIQANINSSSLDSALQQAIATAQTGYFKLGNMVQGLGWERYAYPVTLEQLQAGNANDVILNAHPVTRLAPPQPANTPLLFNKTGSTNGFGAYVMFIPEKQFGLVMLANKNYPNAVRIDAAYQILSAIEALDVQ